MHARDVIDIVARARGHAALVTGPGALAGATFVTSPLRQTIYNMEFGYATATGLGIALAAPERRSVVIEGDGSLLAGMSVFATIARHLPENLVVVAVDNGIYGTGAGRVVTATSSGADIAAIARACGIDDSKVVSPVSIPELEDTMATAMAEPGPWIIHTRVEPDESRASSGRVRPEVDFVEASIRFQEMYPRKER